MSRRLVTRAVFAPLVVAIAATAVPPEGLKSQAYEWATETVPAAIASFDPSSVRDAFERQLLETTATISYVSAETKRRMVEGAGDAVRLHEIVSTRISATTDFISTATQDTIARVDSGLAKIDGWMTAVSLKVIAALPGAPDHIPAPASKRQYAERAPVVTASVPLGLSPFSPFGTRPNKDETLEERAQKVAPEKHNPPAVVVVPAPAPRNHAKPDAKIVTVPSQQNTLPDIHAQPPLQQQARVAAVPAPVEKPAPANPGTTPVASAELEPTPPEIALTAPAPVEAKTEELAQAEVKLPAPAAPAEKSLLARLGLTAASNSSSAPAEKSAITVAPSAPEAAVPLAEVHRDLLAPAETKAPVPAAPRDTSMFASLGFPAKPIEKPAVAVAAPEPSPVAETKPLQQKTPEEKQVVASLGQPAALADKAVPAPFNADEQNLRQPVVDLPTAGTTRLPNSTPLKMRPLTRADIPSPEKFASLTAAKSDTRNLPAEQQRVAYDAPVDLDEPTSIGRRKWVEEANKYQGLGSPDALLEALRHMGANAKTLGLPASLWCADFMNLVLRKSGLKATGSRAARSYLQYGTKIDEPRVGAIAIFTRGKNNGHIGIVRGTDGNGNPIIVSGNHGNKVAESVYPKARVLAYVVPR